MQRFVVCLAMSMLAAVTPALAGEITGTSGNDVLTGRAGVDDVVRALAGNDVVILRGASDTDEIFCGPGNDTVDLSEIRLENRWIRASLAEGRILGTRIHECENIAGSNSPDDDLLTGDDRPNRLEGRRGGDTLEGRGGADTFVYRSWRDSPANGFTDVIFDFDAAGGDRIDLAGLARDVGRLSYSRTGPSGNPGQFWAQRMSAKAIRLHGDRDGDGRADLTISVVNMKGIRSIPEKALKLR